MCGVYKRRFLYADCVLKLLLYEIRSVDDASVVMHPYVGICLSVPTLVKMYLQEILRIWTLVYQLSLLLDGYPSILVML